MKGVELFMKASKLIEILSNMNLEEEIHIIDYVFFNDYINGKIKEIPMTTIEDYKRFDGKICLVG